MKPQIPMSELNYLPPAEKPKQQTQLGLIGPIGFKKRQFFIQISMDRNNR